MKDILNPNAAPQAVNGAPDGSFHLVTCVNCKRQQLRIHTAQTAQLKEKSYCWECKAEVTHLTGTPTTGRTVPPGVSFATHEMHVSKDLMAKESPLTTKMPFWAPCKGCGDRVDTQDEQDSKFPFCLACRQRSLPTAMAFAKVDAPADHYPTMVIMRCSKCGSTCRKETTIPFRCHLMGCDGIYGSPDWDRMSCGECGRVYVGKEITEALPDYIGGPRHCGVKGCKGFLGQLKPLEFVTATTATLLPEIKTRKLSAEEMSKDQVRVEPLEALAEKARAKMNLAIDARIAEATDRYLTSLPKTPDRMTQIGRDITKAVELAAAKREHTKELSKEEATPAPPVEPAVVTVTATNPSPVADEDDDDEDEGGDDFATLSDINENVDIVRMCALDIDQNIKSIADRGSRPLAHALKVARTLAWIVFLFHVASFSANTTEILEKAEAAVKVSMLLPHVVKILVAFLLVVGFDRVCRTD